MKEYKKPLITIASFETEDIITTSADLIQFTQDGDVTGLTVEWKLTWGN